MDPPSLLPLEVNNNKGKPRSTTICTDFVPNKWQPTKCINCFQHHGKTAIQPNKTLVEPTSHNHNHNNNNNNSNHYDQNDIRNWSKKHKESKSVDEGRSHNNNNNSIAQKSQPPTSIHPQQVYLLSPKSPSSPSLLSYFQQQSRSISKTNKQQTTSHSSIVTKPTLTITTTTSTSAISTKSSISSTPTVTSSSCKGFEANLWRPQFCIHCYKTKASHNEPSPSPSPSSSTSSSSNNNNNNTTLNTTLPLKHTNTNTNTNPRARTPSPTNKKEFLSLKSSRENITPPINKDVQRLKEELSSELQEFPSDEHDPFSDISDLTIDEEEGVETNSGVLSWSSNIQSSFEEEEEDLDSEYDYPPTTVVSQMSQMSKYAESEDDWDSGVEIEVLVSQARPSFTYFSNKMLEIDSVRVEIERTRLDLLTNKHMVEALVDVLNAKEKQIQKAFALEKITIHENAILLQTISNILSMLLELNMPTPNTTSITHFTTNPANETNAQFTSLHFSPLTNTRHNLQTQQQSTITPSQTQPSTSSPIHNNVFVVC